MNDSDLKDLPFLVSTSLAVDAARGTIKGDFLRALIELITNSDDSFRRMEHRGLNISEGLIRIGIDRSHSHKTLKLLDNASGMSYEVLRNALGAMGREAVEEAANSTVRATFHQGLKSVILSLGEGKLYTCCENMFSFATLRQSQDIHFRMLDPQPIRKAMKDDRFRDVIDMIGSRGTLIEILMKSEIKIQQQDNLRMAIENDYRLRDILTNSRRFLSLIDLRQQSMETKGTRLQYSPPLAKERINKSLFIQNQEAQLTISIANDPLDSNGFQRQAGILISDTDTIHDCQLFRFQEEPAAAKIMGRFKFPYIKSLIKEEREENRPACIITSERNGLEWKHHPLAVEIKTVLETELAPLIEDLRRQVNSKTKEARSAKQQKCIADVFKLIENIRENELEDEVDPAKNTGNQSSGFEFWPSHYTMSNSEKITLSLSIVAPHIVPFGSKILFSIEENPDAFELLSEKEYTFEEPAHKTEDCSYNVSLKLIGRGIGNEGCVVARCGSLPEAIASLKVVGKSSKEHTKNATPRKKNKSLGSGEITMTNELPANIRARFFSKQNKILLSRNSPILQMYVGKDEDWFITKESRLIAAELITEAIVRHILTEKPDPIMNNDKPMDCLGHQMNNLYHKYNTRFHEIMRSFESTD